MKIITSIILVLSASQVSAQTYFCAYQLTDASNIAGSQKPTDVEEITLQARVVINDSTVELIRDVGDSYEYTILYNKKRVLLAARPAYEKKRGRIRNPGVDTLSLVMPSKKKAKRGARIQIKLGRINHGEPDRILTGTCM